MRELCVSYCTALCVSYVSSEPLAHNWGLLLRRSRPCDLLVSGCERASFIIDERTRICGCPDWGLVERCP
eukprot:6631413-Prymnesium_polylepis.2